MAHRVIVLGRVNTKPLRGRLRRVLTRPPLDAPPGHRKKLLNGEDLLGSEMKMDLKIYGVVLETVGLLKDEMEVIAKRDPDLGNQMRRAAASIALNLSEGSYSQGRIKRTRYHSALGSARETLACIEVGVALGYLPAVREDVSLRMRQILGTLTNLTR